MGESLFVVYDWVFHYRVGDLSHDESGVSDFAIEFCGE